MTKKKRRGICNRLILAKTKVCEETVNMTTLGIGKNRVKE